MNNIQWKYEDDILAGTTLRYPSLPENNNMALHACQDQEAVLNNRAALSEVLGIQPSQWTFAMQTHSDHIQEVTKADAGRGSIRFEDGIPDCDALYTKEKILRSVFFMLIVFLFCYTIHLPESSQPFIAAGRVPYRKLHANA